MKKLLLFAAVLFSLTAVNTFGQIPNSGFENWTSFGSYEKADGWGNPNPACTGPFYPVTKSTDMYPVGIGTYSIRLESNPSLLPSYCALGLSGTGEYPKVKFPITGHPTSLTGWCKFMPQNGDTMMIRVELYNGTSKLFSKDFDTTASISSWTSFTIPFDFYTTADSASIYLSSFSFTSPSPHGNSVLYVDNLNFDNLLTGISEENEANGISVYPNPFVDVITFSIDNPEIKYSKIIIYDILGNVVMRKEKIASETFVFDASHLHAGVYFCEIKTDNKQIRKIIVKNN